MTRSSRLRLKQLLADPSAADPDAASSPSSGTSSRNALRDDEVQRLRPVLVRQRSRPRSPRVTTRPATSTSHLRSHSRRANLQVCIALREHSEPHCTNGVHSVTADPQPLPFQG